jgi:sulfite exporter TauE/SafE
MSPDAASTVESAWLQLMSVGVVWISLHCVGMCGPLLSGLDVGGIARGARMPEGISRVLLYQSGKAITYATFGACAGLLGAGVRSVFTQAGGALALVLGAGVLAYAVGVKARALTGESVPIPITRRASPSSWRARFSDVTALVHRIAFDPRPSRAFFLGALLGFLPCMIPLWVLSLSALSGSVLHGALLMMALVVMNTPVLLGVTLVPRILSLRLRRATAFLPRVLLGVSGVWFVLVGLAGLRLISHAHVGFAAFGRHWMIMFW